MLNQSELLNKKPPKHMYILDTTRIKTGIAQYRLKWNIQLLGPET